MIKLYNHIINHNSKGELICGLIVKHLEVRKKNLHGHFLKMKVFVLKGNLKMVERMNNLTERDGLGMFVFSNIEANTAFAQATSQVAALMVEAGIFKYNGALKGMKFWMYNYDWRTQLEELTIKKRLIR